MSVRIGHASIDENGKVSGGIAGDQNGKEVCIRTWYSKPWEFVLRCKNSSIAEQMAVSCEKGCNNAAIGYNQTSRNALYTQAIKANFDLSKITTKCNCDCSSFMGVCAICAGVNPSFLYLYSNMCTTSTMKARFSNTGLFDVLTESKYLTSDDYLKRGDILVKSGSHTVMVLDNGSAVSNDNSSSDNIKCIDISSYQGNINWKSVKDSGIKYAILRGVLKNGTMDATFDTNYNNASSNGISVIGVYHFSYALNTATAINDAKNLISKLNGKKINIYLDLEWSTQRALGKSVVTAIAKAYVNTCKSLGYTCHIYSNLDWYKNVYSASELSALGCKFWIARYPSADTGIIKESLKPSVGEAMWQYSSKGSVSGIGGNVDMNVVYDSSILTVQIPTIIDDTDESETSIELMGKITASTLRIRKEPNTSSTILGSYIKNDVVQLMGRTSNNWYRTNKGYISGEYVNSAVGQVYNCGGLSVRTSYDVSADRITILKPGDKVTLVTESNGWYKVRLSDDVIGWASKIYIRIT